MLNYKELQTIITMLTEDKVTELFCMADDFCKFFLQDSVSDKVLLCKRTIVETVNDELKNTYTGVTFKTSVH